MISRVAVVVGSTVGVIALVGTALAVSAGGEEAPANPAVVAAAELPAASGFSYRAGPDQCSYDPERGGLVYDGTVETATPGRLTLSFYVQRDSLDDVLPGHVTTVLVFDDDTVDLPVDLVVPVSQDDFEAGYDDCQYHFSPDA